MPQQKSKAKYLTKRAWEFVSSLLFPPRCAFCGKIMNPNEKHGICEDCENSLPRPSGRLCMRCSGELRSEFSLPICHTCLSRKYVFKKNFVPLLYKGDVREALIKMKFNNDPSLCTAFAYLIFRNIVEQDALTEMDFVTFVPISSARMREREYNQSELIARILAELLGKECIPTLVRKDDSLRQSELSLAQRYENAKRSFAPISDLKLGGNALLVDDIYTTGATCAACSILLIKMGCESVSIATASIR
ncbi:MAG: ComF family protein [Clostridia bacterium]|nr:ComF family protein [Clostridia bacterium]